MKRLGVEPALPTEPGFFEFNIPAHETAQTTWTFEPLPTPAMGLTFLPQSAPSPSKKRTRAAADIDGEHSCMQKKKRRLRLFLITSRLSPQFSHPATNIVDRGSSKIAVWAKQRALGRNLLRKAAILNRIRRKAISAREAQAGRGRVLVEQEREQEELELARIEFDDGDVDTCMGSVLTQTPLVVPTAAVGAKGRSIASRSPSTSPTASRSSSPIPTSPPLKAVDAPEYRSPNEAYACSPPRAQVPRRDYLPLPPSPLGLSNYDAFDVDEDIPDPYSHFDDDEESFPNPYTDDDDEDECPFSPSAITTMSSSTAETGLTQLLKTPPQPIYSDFNVLDPGEAVFGDYDLVDDGADAIWPSTFAHEAATANMPGSTSPDFPALFATAPSSSAAKRTDSFVISPNFRPTVLKKSVSPNFPPSTKTPSPNFLPTTTNTTTSTSPNFPSHSPNFPSPQNTNTTTTHPISPNFQAVFRSPNFPTADAEAPSPPQHKRSYSSDAKSGSGEEARPFVLARRYSSDVDQERKRQRDYMFMHFGNL